MLQSADPVASSVTGPIAFMLLLASILAFPISACLIWFYRRAVLRSMQKVANVPVGEPTPVVRTSVPAPAITVYDSLSPIPIGDAAAKKYSPMQGARWTAAAIYALAGGCFALTMTLMLLVSSEPGIYPLQMISLFLVFAFPIVLTVNLVAPVGRRSKLVIAAIYFLVVALVWTVALVTIPGLKLTHLILLWTIEILPATILLSAILTRKIRSVGPLVLVFLFFAILGPQLVISVAASSDVLLHFIMDLAANFGLGAYGVLFGLILFGFLALVPIGWLFLRWMGARYEKKKINDQSIALDAVWLLFGIVNSLLIASNGIVWLFSGFLAFVIYKVAVRAGFAIAGTRADSLVDAKKLLVLRVFALGKQSEKLFGALQTHWRYAGTVQLIAGPDLATSTLEPHEFLDFVSGKLGRRFIDGEQTLARHLSEMDEQPDYDGRFRVHDFFCHDDTWKMVFSRLAGDSDAVVMDLRGFSAQNAGCLFEIGELINTVPLRQILFIIDERTDWQFLIQSLQNAWGQMRADSPNVSTAPQPLSFFRFTDSGGREFRQLIRALCSAAQRP